MSGTTAAAAAMAATPAPAAPGRTLQRVRRIGYAVLGLELALFLTWSTVLYSRFSLTFDFTVYHQAWFLIAHGHFNPFNSEQGFPFWRTHGEFLLWPAAVLYWVWPHDLVLLWIQDAGIVLAEVIAFTWICEIAARRPRWDAAGLATLGLILLVANPWIWWAVSWDFHTESLGIPFVVLLARDLVNSRWRAWLWAAPLLACGDVAATYIVGLGAGAALARRSSRWLGAAVVCAGLAAAMLSSLVHANLGSGHGLHAYAYLSGATSPGAQVSMTGLAQSIAGHPLLVLSTLWAKRADLWANLAPSGLLGIGSLWLFPLVVVIVLANNLYAGLLFAAPSFQGLPLYLLLPVGTLMVIGWLTRRYRRTAMVLACLAAVQAVTWAAVWLPQTPGHWMRTSRPAAGTLARILAQVPPSAEVIASQGVIGRFSGRVHVYALTRPGQISVVHGQDWFVIDPAGGLESLSTASSMALIGELAGPLHATLVTHDNGVWAFRWRPPPGTRRVIVPGQSPPQPAWTSPGAAGKAVLAGPVTAWCVTSRGRSGYVTDGLAWHEPAGRYRAEVMLSASGPVNIEVWNDTGNVLLARRTIAATEGVQPETLDVDATTAYRAPFYQGWGPFRARFIPPPAGQQLEIRVWSPGGTLVNVYSADLTRG